MWKLKPICLIPAFQTLCSLALSFYLTSSFYFYVSRSFYHHANGLLPKTDFVLGNLDILRCVKNGKRLKNDVKVELTVSSLENHVYGKDSPYILFLKYLNWPVIKITIKPHY